MRLAPLAARLPPFSCTFPLRLSVAAKMSSGAAKRKKVAASAPLKTLESFFGSTSSGVGDKKKPRTEAVATCAAVTGEGAHSSLDQTEMLLLRMSPHYYRLNKHYMQ